MKVKQCRCGAKQKEVQCAKTFTCELKCKKTRDCQRHQCNKKCCVGFCPPCEQVPNVTRAAGPGGPKKYTNPQLY